MRRPACRPGPPSTVLLLLIVWAAVASAREPLSADTDSTRWFTQFTHHGAAYSWSDGWDAASVYSVVSTDRTRRRPLRFDLGVPLVEVFRLGARDDIDIAADPLVFLVTAVPLAAASEYCESCETAVHVLLVAVAPAWIPLVRPTAVWQPVPWAGIGIGYDSEYVFLSDDKGATFRPYAALQVDVGHYARVEAGIQQNWMWNWRRASEDLGAGGFLRLAFSTEWLGGARLANPTPP